MTRPTPATPQCFASIATTEPTKKSADQLNRTLRHTRANALSPPARAAPLRREPPASARLTSLGSRVVARRASSSTSPASAAPCPRAPADRTAYRFDRTEAQPRSPQPLLRHDYPGPMADDDPAVEHGAGDPEGARERPRRRRWIVSAAVLALVALAVAGGLVAHASSPPRCRRATALATTPLVTPPPVPTHLPASHDNDAGWSRSPDAYPDADVDRYQLVATCR